MITKRTETTEGKTIPVRPVSEKFVMLTASSEADIQKFIDNLYAAKHSSKITGGVYTAFLPLKGGHILGLEIAVSGSGR